MTRSDSIGASPVAATESIPDRIAGVAVGLLGPVVATVGGEPVNLGGRKQRAVLAVLAMAGGQPVHADALSDAVWGQHLPASAASTLQAYVSHLRRRLEPGQAARSRGGVIVNAGLGYALRIPAAAVDAARFERLLGSTTQLEDPTQVAIRLTEALSLWRGPALLEYADEDWARPQARRLNELRDVARERLISARMDCGETAIVVPEIEALLREEPLREERWRLLVLALYRSHRQGDALAALREARTILSDELGIDPGPALRDLEAEVLAQSDTLAAPSAARASASPPAPASPAVPAPTAVPASTAPTQRHAHEQPPKASDPRPTVGTEASSSTDLVDRERELSQLRRCLESAFGGEPRLALVEGTAGIGKSSLLTLIRREAAAQGATVLAARGSQLEKEYGFGAARQLFEPMLADTARRDSLLAGSASMAAGVFDADSTELPQRPDGIFGILHGLYWLTTNLASAGPVVIAIDDLQWCDSGSLRFLAYLLRRLENMPVCIVATLRTGERYDDDQLLAELVNDPATEAIRPGPLTRAGVAELVHERLGNEAAEVFVAACHGTTSGNPLLLRQLLRALEAENVRPVTAHADTVRAIGSRAVSSLVLMRFARMPAANQQVARAVSVLGDGASLPVIAAFIQQSEQDAATAIASLAKAEVLRPDSPIGFVHPLVEGAVYNDLTSAEQELLHERAARVLTDHGATAEQVAAHLLLVPRRSDPAVVRVLQQAAQRDVSRGAADSAVAYLQRALDEPPAEAARAEILLALGTVEAATNGPASLTHLRAAYDLLTEPQLHADTAILLCRTMVFAGARGEASTFARKALEALPEDFVDQRQTLLALERTAGYMHGLDRASYTGDEVPSIVGTGFGARALAASMSWDLLTDGLDRVRAHELASFAISGGLLRHTDLGLHWVVALNVLQLCGEDTLRHWDEAMADAYAQGALFSVLSVHLWRGHVLWQRGELSEAFQSLADCSEQNELWGATSIGQPYVDAFLIGVLLDQGDLEGARKELNRDDGRLRMGEGVRLFGEAKARLECAEGNYADALRTLDATEGFSAHVANPVWRPWRSLRAVVLAGLGHPEEALDLVSEELALARQWGSPALVGRTLRIRGELLMRTNLQATDGTHDLREAVELLDETPALIERARAHAALGTALAASAGSGRLQQAITSLTTALALAESCGAWGVREQVASQLRAVGVDVSARPMATTLTSTERRIAALAAEGAQDREIAQALFMTPRTVHSIVQALCSRLGVADPSGLGAAIAAH